MCEEFKYEINFETMTTDAVLIRPEEIAKQKKAAEKVALRKLRRGTADRIRKALDDVVGQVLDRGLKLPCIVAIVAQYDRGRRKMTQRFNIKRIVTSRSAFPDHDPRPTINGYDAPRHTAKYPKPMITHNILC